MPARHFSKIPWIGRIVSLYNVYGYCYTTCKLNEYYRMEIVSIHILRWPFFMRRSHTLEKKTDWSNDKFICQSHFEKTCNVWFCSLSLLRRLFESTSFLQYSSVSKKTVSCSSKSQMRKMIGLSESLDTIWFQIMGYSPRFQLTVERIRQRQFELAYNQYGTGPVQNTTSPSHCSAECTSVIIIISKEIDSFSLRWLSVRKFMAFLWPCSFRCLKILYTWTNTSDAQRTHNFHVVQPTELYRLIWKEVVKWKKSKTKKSDGILPFLLYICFTCAFHDFHVVHYTVGACMLDQVYVWSIQ